MISTTLSDFRKNIKSLLDEVTQNYETVILNRGKNKAVVIMSLDEYNALSATNHELKSIINKERLDSAVSKIQSGKSFQKELINE